MEEHAAGQEEETAPSGEIELKAVAQHPIIILSLLSFQVRPKSYGMEVECSRIKNID